MRETDIDIDSKNHWVLVLGNGPSANDYLHVKGLPLVGCNAAFRDHDLTHCVMVDRITVAHFIDQTLKYPQTQFWCKGDLPLPVGFRALPNPTNDSGSSAIKLAHTLYPDHWIMVIGFDGVLNGVNINRYTYRYRNQTTPDKQREIHRQAVYNIGTALEKTFFVNNQPHKKLRTISHAQARKIFKTQT